MMEVAQSDRAQLPAAAAAPIDCFFFFFFQEGKGRFAEPMLII